MNSNTLCSDCFTDYGLRGEAKRIGKQDNLSCLNCNSIDGFKLNLETLEDLAWRFFIQGSYFRAEYGAASNIMLNEYHYNKQEVSFPSWLINDVRLIEDKLKMGFFYYGPRMWMIGEITPLKELKNPRRRKKVINRILESYPVQELTKEDTFYRLRSNPNKPSQPDEYDSAPTGLGQGRFNTDDLPVLYGSQDLEICMHECRVTIADDLYIAILKPAKHLKLLDLTSEIKENCTEFESLNMALHMIFRAEEHSYKLSKHIAKAAKNAGFDGILYPSYFSRIRRDIIPNIAIFGRPIQEGFIKLECINRLSLEQVSYIPHFGPVLE